MEQMTPLDYALASGHEDVAAYLRSQGALTVEEVKVRVNGITHEPHFYFQDLAATHIKSWWKGYRARISLLGAWNAHLQKEADTKVKEI